MPCSIRPVAAMDHVLKFVLERVSSTKHSRKTELCIDKGPLHFAKPNGRGNAPKGGGSGIGNHLKKALGIGPSENVDNFVVTVPQMIATLHLNVPLLRSINSSPV